MKKRKAIVLRPLDVVLSAPSHVAILRALRNVSEGLSGREIARRAGINHQTCADSLVRLEARGVILRIGAGKNQLFHLNRENNLVRTVLTPMLAAEHKQFILMQEDLSRIMAGHCLSGLLFGSIARGEDTEASDFDILLIVKKKAPILHEITRALVRQGMGKWGVRVSPIILTRAEFIKRADKEDPLVTDILKEGIVMCGKIPRGLLR